MYKSKESENRKNWGFSDFLLIRMFGDLLLCEKNIEQRVIISA